MRNNKHELPAAQVEELLGILKTRFEKYKNRHKGISWTKVQERLEAQPVKLWSLNEMEMTGGEPDVTGQDKKTGVYIFMDCSAESPKGRRSVCYDHEALESRKEHESFKLFVKTSEKLVLSNTSSSRAHIILYTSERSIAPALRIFAVVLLIRYVYFSSSNLANIQASSRPLPANI